jgi:branched-chain amino acid transport system permease protein
MSQLLEQTERATTLPRESVARANRRRVVQGGSLLVVGALGLMSIPLLGASGYAVTLAYYAAFYVALGQSWNLMSGLTGYLSVAHAGFLGIGAYTAVLLMNAEQSPALAMVGAVAVSALAAFLVGLPSLRVSGLAFAFTTLFFLEIARLTVTLWTSVTGGGAGIYASRLFDANNMLFLMVGAALLTTLVVLVVRYSQVGRELLAIREDEKAAESIGINVTKLKLITFTASGALAGFVGAVHGAFLGYLLPISVFALELTLIAIALPLIGGMGTVTGPVIAGLSYSYVREQFQVQAPSLHLILLGAAVVLVVLFMPRGIVPAISSRWSRVRRRKVATHEAAA